MIDNQTNIANPDVRGVTALLHRFSEAVDRRRPEQVAALFTDDGLFRPGETEIRGRVAIEALYRERLSDLRRTTRHLWSNIEVRGVTEVEARVTAILTNYAFEPKVSETQLQMRIGDLEGLCALGEDGCWRFVEHLYTRVFATSLPL
ncbi:MAG: ring hydroxylating beta subunit [Caulobacter sp.]|nr:ring hydroxylating beta subunit [Caulobacter sp.]